MSGTFISNKDVRGGTPLSECLFTSFDSTSAKEKLMTNKQHILMNQEEFTTNFTIIKNPFSDFASGGGICFEPHGEELAFVRSHNPACVWTKVIGYDGGVWLYSGYHYEGRIGFILTKEPAPLRSQVEVKWDTPEGMKA